MQSLYTDEVRQYIHTRDWPKGLIMDVYEEIVETIAGKQPVLNFIFYRDNFIQFDTTAQARIAATVQEVMTKLRKDGIHCYMGKMENVPQR